jgi:hypothetical protein
MRIARQFARPARMKGALKCEGFWADKPLSVGSHIGLWPQPTPLMIRPLVS